MLKGGWATVVIMRWCQHHLSLHVVGFTYWRWAGRENSLQSCSSGGVWVGGIHFIFRSLPDSLSILDSKLHPIKVIRAGF